MPISACAQPDVSLLSGHRTKHDALQKAGSAQEGSWLGVSFLVSSFRFPARTGASELGLDHKSSKWAIIGILLMLAHAKRGNKIRVLMMHSLVNFDDQCMEVLVRFLKTEDCQVFSLNMGEVRTSYFLLCEPRTTTIEFSVCCLPAAAARASRARVRCHTARNTHTQLPAASRAHHTRAFTQSLSPAGARTLHAPWRCADTLVLVFVWTRPLQIAKPSPESWTALIECITDDESTNPVSTHAPSLTHSLSLCLALSVCLSVSLCLSVSPYVCLSLTHIGPHAAFSAAPRSARPRRWS